MNPVFYYYYSYPSLLSYDLPIYDTAAMHQRRRAPPRLRAVRLG